MSEFVRMIEAELTDEWRSTAEICDSVPRRRMDRTSAVNWVHKVMSRLEKQGIAEKRLVRTPAKQAEWRRRQ